MKCLDIKSYRERIDRLRKEVTDWNRKGVKGWFQIHYFTKELDAVMRSIFREGFKNAYPSYSIVALGGYGRRELNLCSDIDIMFLYNRLSEEEKEKISFVIQVLWDLGFDIGHSVRSVGEALSLATKDEATKFSYIDARLIGGSLNPYAEFVRKVEKELAVDQPDRFINIVEKWLGERYAKYGSSMYLLEPNIKESPGGLRDIHTILWISKELYKTVGLVDLKRKGLLTPLEYETLAEARDFLWRVRNEIHAIRRRKNDILSIDIQPDVAQALGYRSTEKLLAVEYFMQDFYTHARYVERITKAFILRVKEDFNLIKPTPRIYSIRTLFERKFDTPREFLEEVYRLQQENVEFDNFPKGFWVAPLHWRGRDIYSSDLKDIIIKMLNHRNCYEVLRFLNDIDFIEKLFPEFGRIKGLMQFDLYHRFTVDEHTLLTIKELENLTHASGMEEELKTIYESLVSAGDKYIVVLALLLHDVGKGKGGGHAVRGAKIAAESLVELGFSDEEAQEVAFLVRYHTLMPEVALRRDIADPNTVLSFASVVGNDTRLDRLYVLTYADLKAVGPDVWNDWKAALLRELYLRTKEVFSSGRIKDRLNEHEIKMLVDEVTKRSKIGDRKVVKRILSSLSDKELISFGAETLALFVDALCEAKGEEISVCYKVVEDGPTELVVAKEAVAGDFYKIMGIISSRRVNIQEAFIVPLDSGFVVDLVRITDAEFRPIKNKRVLEDIAHTIKKVLAGNLEVEDELRKRHVRLSRRERAVKLEPKVVVNNKFSEKYTVIEIKAQDRLGLLYRLARRMAELGLNIHMAKVTTEGNRAVDAFYVTKGGHKLKEHEIPYVIRAIKEAID